MFRQGQDFHFKISGCSISEFESQLYIILNKKQKKKSDFYQHFYKANQGYVALAMKFWLEFCDLNADALPKFLLCCKFQTIISTNVEVAETQSYYAMCMCKTSK